VDYWGQTSIKHFWRKRERCTGCARRFDGLNNMDGYSNGSRYLPIKYEYKYKYCETVLEYYLSTSTSTKYYITVYNSVVYNTAQNSLPSYHPDNHHSMLSKWQ